MANKKQPLVDPLAWNVPIVDKAGFPNPEFMRKWASQRAINDVVPWNAASMSSLLDLIGATKGDLLLRGSTQWGVLLPPGNAATFLNGAILPAFAAVKDTDLALTDVTSNDVSAARHGFAPKLPNDATKYLDGTGHYTAPPDTDPLLGTAVPSVVEPAGWLYSRSGAKELYQSNPTSTPPLAIVQHKSAINGNTVPGAVTLAAPPTAGNLIVMFLHTNVLASLVTKNTTGWTEFENVVSSTSQVGSGLYRYAQLGDTATLPALWTAGSTYWAYAVYEISGVSGVFAADALGHNQTTTATPTTNVTGLTSAAIVTTLPNALALLGAGQYNGNADPTLSVGWTRDEFGHNNTNYGSDVGGSQAVAASGASVSVTVSFTTNSASADLILLVLQAPTVQVQHWDLFSVTISGHVLGLGGTLNLGYADVSGLAAVAHTGAYADLSGTPAIPAGANPTAVASDTAVNGAASTFMRSDGAPAVRKGSNAAFGVVKVDNTTITATGGTITAASTTLNGYAVAPGGILNLADTDIVGTTTGAIPFVASGKLTEDASHFLWDVVNSRLVIGNPVAVANSICGVGGTVGNSQIDILNTGVFTGTRASAVAVQSVIFRFIRAHGTIGTQTVLVNGDTVGSFQFQGFDGAAAKNAAQFSAFVIEPTPSSTAMGGSLRFLTTPLGSITVTEVARFENATGLSMFGANSVIDANRVFRLRPFTVATLPAGVDGMLAFVTDALLPAALTLVGGGGARHTPVFYDGALAQWTVS